MCVFFFFGVNSKFLFLFEDPVSPLEAEAERVLG